ncbi:hypothetical protein GALL_477080 [mine drainage metagenome]|uniref:Uncharacterized protein n=1 Tax=mine drainage metagenome TaxID=410659 RepID=A0A1J5PGW3_9ZZZZ
MRLRQGHTQHLGGTSDPQCDNDRLGHSHLLVIHRAANCLCSTANVNDELGDALNVLNGQVGVNTAFEPVPGIGGKIESARAPGNRSRPPEGSFNINILCVIRHRRGITAHDTRERLDLVLVGNHTHLRIHCDGRTVQQLELLSRLAPADIESTVNLVKVKNMRRAPQLKHHIV